MSKTPGTSKKPGTAFARRDVLKLAAKFASLAGVAMPALISRGALASSGEINIMMWSDYLPESFVKGFTEKTGIKVNFTGIGSNDDILNKMKASNGQGFDIVTPTVNRSPLWKDLGLLMPFDMKKVAIDKVNPAMALGETHWNFAGKGSHWLPHIWGTEGVSWRTDKFTPAGTAPSYYDVWDDANAGKTMGRGHSMILGLGLGMERRGELAPGSVWEAYKTPEKMTEVWTKLTEVAIKKKKNIKLVWNDADAQKNGLLNEGVIVGQTWDGPPIALKTAGEPVMYRAPVEGAMAWVDGLSLPIGAKNIDQIYAFIDACYDAKLAGEAIKTHGYNSPVIGADRFGGEVYAKNFADAYPGDSLAKLNPWPAEAPWYASKRSEFTNKFMSA